MVTRIDSASIQKAIRRDNGLLIAPCVISRAGIFEYRLPNGTIRRELRPPEEVFKQDSMDSFAFAPLTNDHPSVPVTAKNAKKLSIGSLGEYVRQDGNLLAATLVVTDAAAIAQIEAGKCELSCGYECTCDETPGTYEGQRFDAVQRGIKANHVALVSRGRAGVARIRLDSAGIQVERDTISSIEGPMSQENEIKADAAPESKADAAPESKPVNEPQSQVTAAVVIEAPPAPIAPDYQAECVKQTARADAAEAEVAKQKAQVAELVTALAAANAPSRIQSLVAARFALESRAKSLAPSVKCDGLSDSDLKLAVIDARDPGFVGHQRRNDSVYVDARFDVLEPEIKTNKPEVVRVDSIPAPIDHRAEYLAAVLNASKSQQ